MHRFPSRSTIFRLQFCAVLYLAGYSILITSVLAVLVFMVMKMEARMVHAALVGLGFGAVLLFLQWLLSQRVFCPLCRMPVMGKKTCNRHRHAARVLSSYRLPVVKGALITGWFRCPYCNEPSELEVRERGRFRNHHEG